MDLLELFNFADRPGNVYVVATLLPLLAFVLSLLIGAKRAYLSRYRNSEGTGQQLYQMVGGDNPPPYAAYLGTAAMALAFVLTCWGFWQFSDEYHELHHGAPGHGGHGHATHGMTEEKFHQRWNGNIVWAALSTKKLDDPEATRFPDALHGTVLTVGYHIDHLAALMFLMVTLISTLIFLFSIGYMSEERAEMVEDHEVHTDHGHLKRRGRFNRFFLFLSLFCFSMLNLVLADNLFQVFVSWELVGICSYLLIGFYFERQSASDAANKAFITNRIGDAGFIIGLLIFWTYVGTFNFEDLFKRVRSPEVDAHNKLYLGGQIVKAEPVGSEEKGVTKLRLANLEALVTASENDPKKKEEAKKQFQPLLQLPVTGPTHAVLFPRAPNHLHGLGPKVDGTFPKAAVKDQLRFNGYTGIQAHAAPDADSYGSMPYWLLVLGGIGLFLGCVGKSAQFPLHVWLPDAMEGPTPVSALIHAATMVAAGVYLVGRCYPLFTPEVLLIIAYTGAITLFVAATIAVVMTDIKKVLAYSTVSQLGYMMLGLGVGGWVAGLFHLLTHAFFKALLFLGSGSVIYGCHHVQDMGKMGGLYPKMKVTALTMLMGVLAIAGTPLFSGWYSKDAIVAQALGFTTVHRDHTLLFLLPLVTAGITTFYMFRMWYLTFTGAPRDHHVHEHAKESPTIMTGPLVILAAFSIFVAWGWPIWDPEASWLEHQLHHSQPKSVLADFGQVTGVDEPTWIPFKDKVRSERYQAHELHALAGNLALIVVLIGFVFATAVYYYRVFDPADAKEQVAGLHRFLTYKWYFDELYSVLLVRPAVTVAQWCKSFDLNVIDGLLHTAARLLVWSSKSSGKIDNTVIDGVVNLLGNVCWDSGTWLRRVQTGYIRSYVLFLVLAAVALWALLSFLLLPAAAGM